MSLADAYELLRKNKPSDALLVLLDAWRAVRHPRIADVIDLVSAQVTSTAPIPGKTVAERDDAWREIARKKRAFDLGRLVSVPWPKQWRAARPLLDLLDRFPDDPRLAAVLVRTLVDPPYESNASAAFYVLVVDKLVKLADPRGVSLLREVTHRATKALASKAADAIARKPVAAIDEGAITSLERFFAAEVASASADAERGDALLDAIYDAPDDDAPRAVYADWLTERGDVRGELITLQLAGPERTITKRERKLLDEHGRTWAGRIGALFRTESHVFDRGFFAGGDLQTRAREHGLLFEDPAAKLLRKLDYYGEPGALPELLDHLPALRELSTFGPIAAAVAGHATSRPITKLAFSVDGLADTPIAMLAECRALPKIDELAVYCSRPADAEWLIAAPVLDRITKLSVLGPGATLDIATALAARQSALREFVVGPQLTWKAKLSRTGATFDRCKLDVRDGRAYGVWGDLAVTINCIPLTVQHLEIDPGRHAMASMARGLISPSLERFAGATLVIPWL